MHISDIIRKDSPTFSFEFFPPKTPAGAESLYQTIRELEAYMPHFVSVTYGAGGSTRELTHDLVERIKTTTKLNPIPHLTCVCHKEDEIEAIIRRYASNGIGNILALGGDPPRGCVYDKSADTFQNASDLVKFIRRFNETGVHPDPRGFGIGVAGFPEGHIACKDGKQVDWNYLKGKIDAGADYVLTQLFFDNGDFFEFRDHLTKKLGVNVPLVPGIIPILSATQIKKFTAMCGARIPARLAARLDEIGTDDNAAVEFGIEYATEQCRELLKAGAPGIHFYTLNKAPSTVRVLKNLGLA